MTVNPTSPEYTASPRWFWGDKKAVEFDEALYNTIRKTIYDTALGQPWVGVSAAQAEQERCFKIGKHHGLGWACSPFFDVWVASLQFRCMRFVQVLAEFPPKPGTRFLGGIVAVCVSGASLDQVMVIEPDDGVQWPEKRPPQPEK